MRFAVQLECGQIVGALLLVSVGGPLADKIGEFAFEFLDAPIHRLGGKDIPVGFSPILENSTLPQTADVLNHEPAYFATNLYPLILTQDFR